MAWLDDDTVPGAAQAQPYRACAFRIKWATEPWELAQGHALRKQVFCEEQGIFKDTDRDAIDDVAQTIVALSCLAGQLDRVVGTVRIHSPQPGLWWGSRLAVANDYRHHARIGATLISMAVRSAHARECHRFLAHVQSRNVPLFERLAWQSLETVQLHGHPHALMAADLASYPPCATPEIGWITLVGEGRA